MANSYVKNRTGIVKTPHFSISIIGILVIFVVTFFIYMDFEIRMIYGYALLGVCVLFYLCAIRFKPHLSKEKSIFFFLAMMISLFVFCGSDKEGTLQYAIGMDLCVLIAVLYEPREIQYFKAMKIFCFFSTAFSLYSILAFVFPEIYQIFVKPIISEGSVIYNEELLRSGYGVALGANVAFIDYIVVTGLIFSLSCFFAKQSITKFKILDILSMIICFLGMLCANRKGELLAALITVYFIYRDHMKKSNKIEKAKTRRIVGVMIIFTLLLVVYLAQKGYLLRFYLFFNKIARNLSNDRVDISSGRIAIWKYAWSVFKQNPVLGIGWENFFVKIPEYDVDTVKVHNNFLQLLCETGVIGFVLIAIPMIVLLIWSYHYMKRYSYSKQNYPLIRIAYTTSFGIQFFFFVLDFLDPCIYKMHFWPIYAISIMSLVFARTYEKKFILSHNGQLNRYESCQSVRIT